MIICYFIHVQQLLWSREDHQHKNRVTEFMEKVRSQKETSSVHLQIIFIKRNQSLFSDWANENV